MLSTPLQDFQSCAVLLKTSPALSYRMLLYFLNSNILWEDACSTFNFLQALFTGIKSDGVPVDALSQKLVGCVLAVPTRYEAAALCYWAFLGVAVKATYAATVADAACLSAILANAAAAAVYNFKLLNG